MARGGNREGGENNANENNSQQIIVLNVYLHCEECAKPIVKCLRGIAGVKEVNTNLNDHMVTVSTQKDVDPKMVVERVEKNCNKQVILIASKLKDKKESEKKMDEPKIIQVVLNMYIHCENCGTTIKEGIQQMIGVQTVEVDMANLKVVVKGEFEPQKLVDHIDKRMGKQAIIVKIENQKRRQQNNNENNNNNDNNNNNNSGNNRRMTNVHGPLNDINHVPQNLDFEYAAQMLSDENSQACVIM